MEYKWENYKKKYVRIRNKVQIDNRSLKIIELKEKKIKCCQM